MSLLLSDRKVYDMTDRVVAMYAPAYSYKDTAADLKRRSVKNDEKGDGELSYLSVFGSAMLFLCPSLFKCRFVA